MDESRSLTFTFWASALAAAIAILFDYLVPFTGLSLRIMVGRLAVFLRSDSGTGALTFVFCG